MNKKRNSIPFSLIKISTEQFAAFQENFESGNYDFNIVLDTRVDLSSEQKIIGVFTKYSFFQDQGLVLILECGCHFELNEDYWKDNLQDNTLTLDKGLLTHFIVLTVGTSRGVLHVKKPKWLESMLLPTLNVTSIIRENMSFDLTSDKIEGEVS